MTKNYGCIAFAEGLEEGLQMKNDRGITLVELIIVVSIIGILAVSLGFSFRGWMGGYKVESQMKEMYIDLMNARARAMHKNRMHFVSLETGQYIVYEDTNTAPDGDEALQTASDTNVLQKTLSSAISWSDATDNTIVFTRAGLSDLDGIKTLCSESSANADFNCILVTASRINLGKLATKISDGGVCSETNCLPK